MDKDVFQSLLFANFYVEDAVRGKEGEKGEGQQQQGEFKLEDQVQGGTEEKLNQTDVKLKDDQNRETQTLLTEAVKSSQSLSHTAPVNQDFNSQEAFKNLLWRTATARSSSNSGASSSGVSTAQPSAAAAASDTQPSGIQLQGLNQSLGGGTKYQLSLFSKSAYKEKRSLQHKEKTELEVHVTSLNTFLSQISNCVPTVGAAGPGKQS